MIAAIERAIVSAVAAEENAGTLGYTYGTLTSFDQASTVLEMGTIAYPALWSIYDGEEPPERLGDKTYRRKLRFAVFVAAEQWLNVSFSRYRSETGLPGAYQLAEDVWALLADNDLGLDMAPLAPAEIRPELAEPNLTICRLDFIAVVVAPSPEGAANLGEYLRHHIDWDVEPLGNVVPPLPTEIAEARDDIAVRITAGEMIAIVDAWATEADGAVT